MCVDYEVSDVKYARTILSLEATIFSWPFWFCFCTAIERIYWCSSLHLFIPFVHSFIHSFIYSFIPPFLPSFLPSFIYSFIHSFTHSFIHSFIHSFACLIVRSFSFPQLVHLLIDFYILLDIAHVVASHSNVS